MKVRIKFRKYGSMKFIGHLDMMRYFQKAMRRADIDISYTKGYSPHQVMSFAAPLGVGVTSDGEYLDIEVNSLSLSSEAELSNEAESSNDLTLKLLPPSREVLHALCALNAVMANGIEVLSLTPLPDSSAHAMSQVVAADYQVIWNREEVFPYAFADLEKALTVYWEDSEEILVTKKTKKGERIMDLKPLIYELKATKTKDELPALFMKLSTGSTDNVKPELVLDSLFQNGTCRTEDFRIHRLEVYAKNEDAFIPLSEAGK
ncbi:radical SAM protein [Clostridia bacterium]|nr:radical SAM protein [Clostridia bacterium]